MGFPIPLLNQRNRGIPGYIKANARALACIKGGALSSTHMLDQSLLNNGTRRTGEEGRCFLYDGTDDYSELDSEITLSGDFSLSFWINATDLQARHLFFKSISDRIYFSHNALVVVANTLAVTISISPSLSTGVNYSLVLIRNNGALKLFVDGTEQSDIEINSNDLAFSRVSNSADSLSSKMFDIRIYNKALTQSEVDFVYSFGQTGTDPDLPIHWWKCDEQSGTVGYDSVGGNHLTHNNITEATFHATQDIWSFQNQVGYNNPLDRSQTVGGALVLYPFAAQPVSSYQISYWVKCDNYTGASIGALVWDNVNGIYHYFQGASGVYRAKHIAVNLATTNGYADGLWHRVNVSWNGSVLTLTVDSETVSTAASGAITSTNLLNAIQSTGGTTTSISNLEIIIDGVTIFNSGQGDPAIDLSGNENNATNLGGSVLGDGIGIYLTRDESDPINDVLGNPLTYTGRRPNDFKLTGSNCLTLNGTNQAVRVGDNAAFDFSTALTLSCWVKNDASGLVVNEYAISKYDTGANKREIAFGYDLNEKLIFVVGNSDGSGATTQTSDSVITIDSLNHIVATYDSGTVILYVNGQLVASTASGSHVSTLNNEDADLIIGGALNSDSLTNHWDGQLFDARLYNRVLSALEIQSIYEDSRNLTDDANLVGRWKCQEGAGIICHDSSVNENHGTIENAASNWGVTQDLVHSNLLEGHGKRMYFDGSSDIELAGDATLNITGDLTVDFEISTDSSATQIIYGGYAGSSPYQGFGVGLNLNGIGASSKEICVWTGTWITTGYIIPDNAMVRVTISYRALDNQIKTYIDGVLTDTSAGSNIATYSGVRYLGRVIAVSAFYMTGVLSNFKLFNVLKDESEINNLENDTSGLVLKLNGYGNTDADWIDISGNGNDGTVNGSPSNIYLPAKTSSVDIFDQPLTHPAGDYHNDAETTVDFDPDSTPEMGTTQLGITVPSAHAFGDAFTASDQIFSRQRSKTEDRFLVFPEAQTGSALTTIQKYTQP